jgi:threonine aldolase
MKRRGFIELGGLLAASSVPLTSIAGKHQLQAPVDPNSKEVDFIYDGINFSPSAYAGMLMQMADEGKIKTDNYSNGGVVEALENKFAAMLGKESAVFMPTGTLANHIAIRKLADNHRRVIVQEQSHVYNDTGDGAQTLSGLNLLPLGKNEVGFTHEEVLAIDASTQSGRVQTHIGVISIETPVRRQFDRIMPFNTLQTIADFARNKGIKMHLDGARLFVQTVHTNISAATYATLFDTVYISMYKCFNAASGAILAGTKAFTENLYHERRMFGGGINTVWPSAAIALHFADSFEEDYKKAWQHAETLFYILKKNERFSITHFQNGTHVIKLDVQAKNLSAFRNSLGKMNIQIGAPVERGFLLKINPTIVRNNSDELAACFTKALKDAE